MLYSICEKGIVETDRDKSRTRREGGYRGQGKTVVRRIYPKLDKMSRSCANLGEHFEKGGRNRTHEMWRLPSGERRLKRITAVLS